MKTYLPLPPQTRTVYIAAVFLASLVALAIVWYTFNTIFTTTRSIAMQVAANLSSGGTDYNSVDSFFFNVAKYVLIFMLFVLVVWSFQTAQKKGRPVYA